MRKGKNVHYFFYNQKQENWENSDSERSDECIDFTMMWGFFYFCVCHQVLKHEPSFVGVKSEKFLIVFCSVRKNPKKVTEKQEFLRKTSFRQNRFFYMVVPYDLNFFYKRFGNSVTRRYLNILPLFIDN
ncbi:Uncharacterized protein FWK35_00009505 [Aphis craccivora]|uniref:Uncharacterized protein n=1 Tax=Aphis craccivora TaxID=307492 RepID=A0A6G0ZHE2_APHCR|nr:Uncharacterized protein FWK35_00009505 [Aphis craccivora]